MSLRVAQNFKIAYKIGDSYSVDNNPRISRPNFTKENSYKNDLPIHTQQLKN